MIRKLKTDKYGNALLSIKEGKEALLRGMDIDLAIFDDAKEVDLYNRSCEQVMGYKAVIRHPLNSDMDMQIYHSECREHIIQSCINKRKCCYKERGCIGHIILQ